MVSMAIEIEFHPCDGAAGEDMANAGSRLLSRTIINAGQCCGGAFRWSSAPVWSARASHSGDRLMTTPADLLAVQRAHATHGHDAALAEIRRRWPEISDTVLPATLERILAPPVEQSAPLPTVRVINAKEMVRAPGGQFLGRK